MESLSTAPWAPVKAEAHVCVPSLSLTRDGAVWPGCAMCCLRPLSDKPGLFKAPSSWRLLLSVSCSPERKREGPSSLSTGSRQRMCEWAPMARTGPDGHPRHSESWCVSANEDLRAMQNSALGGHSFQ